MKPTYEQLEESVDYLTEHLVYANEQLTTLQNMKLRLDTLEESRTRLVDENVVLCSKVEDLEAALAAEKERRDDLRHAYNELAEQLGTARSNFAAAYNALRNIRLYLRKHVDDIPYEHRDTLKRFCDEGGVTDTVLRSSSSDLADVAFPPQE